jgi:DNA-binding beta-propeller fold protein YncE
MRRLLHRVICLSVCAIGVCFLLPIAASARSVLFVGNVDDGTVTLVDMGSLRVLGGINVIPDGAVPQDPAQAALYPALVRAKGTNYVQGIALSPDGQTLYVSRGFLGDVAAFRVGGGQMLWRLQTSSVRADHIGLSRDGQRLFVSALSSNQVQVIDTRTHAFVGSLATGDWPHVIEFSPDGRLVYNGSLGNQLAPSGADGAKQLTVADAATFKVVRTYPFDVGVRPFAITPDGATAFVQLSYLNGFVELDLRGGKIVKTVNLPVMGPALQMQPKDYPNQAAHHGIALSHDGKYICDAATISNYVALVSRPQLNVASIIPVGDQPAEAKTSADGHYCLVTNRGPGANADFVSIISYTHRKVVAIVPTGHRPQEEEEHEVPDPVLQAGGFLGPTPTLTKITLSRHRLALGRGPSLRFTLSREATVTISIERLVNSRWRHIAKLTVTGHSGDNTVQLPGRLRHRPLPPGRYRVLTRARTDDGLDTHQALISYTVAR